MVDKMNEMDFRLKDIKMKHEQWNVDWMKQMRWNMNNEVDNVTLLGTKFVVWTMSKTLKILL